MRYHVKPRDVPPAYAAKRLGITLAAFTAMLDRLSARGFPQPDFDTGNYDLEAIDRWCNARNAHLFEEAAIGARNADDVVMERIRKMNHG